MYFLECSLGHSLISFSFWKLRSWYLQNALFKVPESCIVTSLCIFGFRISGARNYTVFLTKGTGIFHYIAFWFFWVVEVKDPVIGELFCKFLDYTTKQFFHCLQALQAVALFFLFLGYFILSLCMPFQLPKVKYGNCLNIGVDVLLFLGLQMQKQL